MRVRRPVAFALLAAFLCGFTGSWLGDAHRFNDDPHWSVPLGGDHAQDPRVGTSKPADTNHCAVCHLLRIMRTASRPASAVVVRDTQQVAPPGSTDPHLPAALSRHLRSRGPPTAFL